MSDPQVYSTPVTEHVHACVEILNEKARVAFPGRAQLRHTLGDILRLVDMDWEGDEDPDWREGYETCILDVIDAIAMSWEVELPSPEWRPR